jgi:hypothetical protein
MRLKVVTNVDKTSNLIDIALKFQKLLKLSQAFVEKATEFVNKKITNQGTLHPNYYMYGDIE